MIKSVPVSIGCSIAVKFPREGIGRVGKLAPHDLYPWLLSGPLPACCRNPPSRTMSETRPAKWETPLGPPLGRSPTFLAGP